MALLEVKDLTAAYGGIQALRGVSLKVEEGQIVAVLGANGAGKSTLVRCINLLERPQSGKVIVDGKDLLALDAAQLRETRKKIGMIFQHFNLIPRLCNHHAVFDRNSHHGDFAIRRRTFRETERRTHIVFIRKQIQRFVNGYQVLFF